MVKEAIERVDELTKLPSQDADLWYEFACIYSWRRIDRQLCSCICRSRLELLNQAVRLGYDDGKKLQADSDLKQLRDRDDFKTLAAEVESRASKPKAIPDKPPVPVPE